MFEAASVGFAILVPRPPLVRSGLDGPPTRLGSPRAALSCGVCKGGEGGHVSARVLCVEVWQVWWCRERQSVGGKQGGSWAHRRARTESLKERHSDVSSMAWLSSTRPHSCVRAPEGAARECKRRRRTRRRGAKCSRRAAADAAGCGSRARLADQVARRVVFYQLRRHAAVAAYLLRRACRHGHASVVSKDRQRVRSALPHQAQRRTEKRMAAWSRGTGADIVCANTLCRLVACGGSKRRLNARRRRAGGSNTRRRGLADTRSTRAAGYEGTARPAFIRTTTVRH